MRSYQRVIALVAACAALWSGSALAGGRDSCFPEDLNNIDPSCLAIGLTIPFDTLPPGARSLGLGGAFTGVADDATAAEANPAGQVILTRPEFSIHGRRAEYDVPFGSPNILEAAVFGNDVPAPFSTYEDENTKISFASFVYPFEHFVLSGYYHNAGALDSSTFSGLLEPSFLDVYAESTFVDVEQESFGLSGAFRLNDMFSIGASIKYAKLEIDYGSISALSDFRDQEFVDGVPDVDNALAIDDFQSLSTFARGDDHDLTYNIGILINPNGKWSGGVVYKEGGSYDIDTSLEYFTQFDCNGVVTCDPDAGFNGNFVLLSGDQSIDLPDVLSLGLALRPSDTWLLSFQFDRIGYDDLPQQRTNSLIFAQPAAAESVDAEWVAHFGVEKTFLFEQPVLGMSLLSVRAGAFTDPDHDGFRDLDTDETHYTFGIGTVFFDDLQVDVGAEWSDKIDNVVLSAVYRF